MNTREFRERGEAALGGRGWITQLARITGKDITTAKRWAAGDLPVPEYVVAIIELLELVPQAMRPARFQRPPRAQMAPRKARKKRK